MVTDSRARMVVVSSRLADLAGFKCPQSFEFTTGELRTRVGKIRRGPLRERFGLGPGRYQPRLGRSS